ncbi:hypothetical protein FE257_001247 [Aspergillus nanangensis]|uniref:RRM domain-containing protein n=1 Tax=Aspergillus nanangensis TaxID=2582783 RepID=A0AAD4GPR8_ASPNN|nr:hypothetical protein FE257_001247 [Aspergillus nanangensis]
MASRQSDGIPQKNKASFSPTSPSRQPTPFYAVKTVDLFAQPDPSTLALHQRQYLAMLNPAFAQNLAQSTEIDYGLSQTPTPTLMDPTGQRRRAIHAPIQRSVPILEPAPSARVPSQPIPSEIFSPASRRATQISLHPVMDTDHRGQFPNVSRSTSDAPKRYESAVLANNLPIGSLVHLVRAPIWGVIKISNIPYSVTKQEIIQFVGRQANIITSDNGCPIHIIMERSTAKTMDCYVEFQTCTDAKETVHRINKVYEVGRAPRLGNRHVDVELSDQDELLKDLFPRAKCAVWRNGIPHALANTDHYSTGFNGFFTSEEIVGAIRHAELPHRSPFCVKCPQRTYESTISTLYKARSL